MNFTLIILRRRSDRYLVYKRERKILKKWLFISQHALLFAHIYTDRYVFWCARQPAVLVIDLFIFGEKALFEQISKMYGIVQQLVGSETVRCHGGRQFFFSANEATFSAIRDREPPPLYQPFSGHLHVVIFLTVTIKGHCKQHQGGL